MYFFSIKMRIVFFSFPAVTCSELGRWTDFSNGRITFNASLVGGRYPLYTVATYHCNSGYNREGGHTSTCSTSGNWQGLSPTCKKKKSNAKSCFLHVHFVGLNIYFTAFAVISVFHQSNIVQF